MDIKELELKLAVAVKDSNAKLEKQLAELSEAQEKALKPEAIEALKAELIESGTKNQEIIALMQKQMDTLATDLKKSKETAPKSVSEFNQMLAKNFDGIKSVSKTNPVTVQIKDMTLGNALTGDQPRTYNQDVVMRPAQMVNVSDLAQSFPIEGGTYTYTRSTLASGTVAAQTEGSLKGQLEYDYATIDANTDFIAGFAVYSKKMRNNLPFLQNTLSVDLRRDYYRGENVAFQTIVAAGATPSVQVITLQNKIEMLIAEIKTLAGIDFMATSVVVTPADFFDILITEKSTGAGYGLPGVVTFDNGTLRINGIAVLMATWLPANKYYVGDWSRVRQPITEGFSFEVSEADSDNFRKNNITARVESQTTITVEQPDALIYGDFTAI